MFSATMLFGGNLVIAGGIDSDGDASSDVI
jgi:hypothetical protein